VKLLLDCLVLLWALLAAQKLSPELRNALEDSENVHSQFLCDQGLMETYERRKGLFLQARVVWLRQLVTMDLGIRRAPICWIKFRSFARFRNY
jgi:hypothetical protein